MDNVSEARAHRQALSRSGFNPTAYLLDWHPPSEAAVGEQLRVRFIPVKRYGHRLLLGSGRYVSPRDDFRFVHMDQVSERPKDPLVSFTVPADRLPQELSLFLDLPDSSLDHAGPPEPPEVSRPRTIAAERESVPSESVARQARASRELRRWPPSRLEGPPAIWLSDWDSTSGADVDAVRRDLLRGALAETRRRVRNYSACLEVFREAVAIGDYRLGLSAIRAIHPREDADWGISEVFQRIEYWRFVNPAFSRWAAERLATTDNATSWYRGNAIGWLGAFFLMTDQPNDAKAIWSLHGGEDSVEGAIVSACRAMLEASVDISYVLSLASHLRSGPNRVPINIAASRALGSKNDSFADDVWVTPRLPQELVVPREWASRLLGGEFDLTLRRETGLVREEEVDGWRRISVSLLDLQDGQGERAWWYVAWQRTDAVWPVLLSRERDASGGWAAPVEGRALARAEDDGRLYWLYRGGLVSSPIQLPAAAVKWLIHRNRLVT